MGAGFSIKAKANSEADILIYEDVGEGFFGGVSAKQFADDLQALGSVKTINLRISSLGGDVNEGLAIYRRLVDHPAKVVSHIDGWAASIASVIAMAGNEIIISESGAIMIHDAWAVAGGNAKDFRNLADRLEANSGAIADVYIGRTQNSVGQIRAWMAEEKWFYGKEAVEAKFADSVAANLKVAARYDPSKHNFRNVPKELLGTPVRDSFKGRLSRMRSVIERRRASAA